MGVATCRGLLLIPTRLEDTLVLLRGDEGPAALEEDILLQNRNIQTICQHDR